MKTDELWKLAPGTKVYLVEFDATPLLVKVIARVVECEVRVSPMTQQFPYVARQHTHHGKTEWVSLSPRWVYRTRVEAVEVLAQKVGAFAAEVQRLVEAVSAGSLERA
jgi:hypothetical protein